MHTRRILVICVGLTIFATATGQRAAGQSSQSSSGQSQDTPSQQLPGVQLPPRPPQITNLSPEGDGRERDRELSPEDRNLPRYSQPTALAALPPEPDIEFQEMIAGSLGYRLPIFGQDLFRNVPSTFAPLDHVPVTPEYVIGPGDELLIRAWGQVEINGRAVVDRNGTIYLPKVGTLTVAGQRYDHLHEYLQTAIGSMFKNFELSVTMGQLRSIQVFVVGQVRRPGVYTISSLSTLVNALFASGGPSKRGSMRRIQLKRQGQPVTTFDLYALLVKGDKSRDVALLPGDVIYVPPVSRLAALAGSVNVPGIFELQEHDTLADVIAFAGGLTVSATAEHATLERIGDHHIRRVEEVSLASEGLKRELQSGDLVRFLHISSKFENAVTLRGNVAIPGRYAWHAGMRVHDLIPTRDALITEEYWKRQSRLALDPMGQSFKTIEEQRAEKKQQTQQTGQAGQLALPGQLGGQPAQSEQLGQAGQSERRAANGDAQRDRAEEIKNEVKRSAAEINWEYAVVERLDLDTLTTELLPFNLGKAIAGEESQNLPLQSGDVIVIFSQADLQVPIARQSKFVRMEGEFQAGGVYRVQPGETLRQLVTRVGGFTPQAYLYGAEFTRESTQKDQQKRLDQYINEMEKNVERSAGGLRGRTGDEAAAESQALEGQRRLLEKLRLLKATGRIVLELKPTGLRANSDSIEQLPDLVLEDGDRLVVPFRPATVDVIGAIYNSNAFVFKPGKTVSDYLRLAGGVSASGDRGRAFVIRADGSTVAGRGHRGLIGNDFGRLRLEPGDTIVVPEKLNQGAALRGFKDWTQIIGQFVLGAAAAKVLFP